MRTCGWMGSLTTTPCLPSLLTQRRELTCGPRQGASRIWTILWHLLTRVCGKRILGSSWNKLTRAVSLRSLLTWVAAEGVDPRVTRLQAGRKGIEAAVLSPSNFLCTTPRRREGQEDGVGRRLVGPGHGRRDDAALCDPSCVERGPSPSSVSQEGAVAREPLLPEDTRPFVGRPISIAG